ncbi:unnamed protein product [Arctia plantaginis]|uniref:Uncharacterized protein n=1 Tax=Arctia plantaginis TaxID=874455 RepID=A0A8S0Z2T6_ARCPL|nr:unnamed protein product [Arctia plantaginis]
MKYLKSSRKTVSYSDLRGHEPAAGGAVRGEPGQRGARPRGPPGPAPTPAPAAPAPRTTSPVDVDRVSAESHLTVIVVQPDLAYSQRESG